VNIIYVLCPDNDSPIGGIKQLYRHVDILNAHGFPAFILHKQEGFRCTWFANETRITYSRDDRIDSRLDVTDFVVVPEVRAHTIPEIARGTKKVIFNQGCYLTFRGYSLDRSLDKQDLETPYRDEDVMAAFVVSDDSRDYLQHTFADLRTFRLYYWIDQSVFSFVPIKQKKRKIAFVTNKNEADIVQVINILKLRGAIKDYDLVPIARKSQTEVACILRESAIFLSFGRREGFSLPPAEAMACGCIVVGYHGGGGKEYFKQDFSYPIPNGDVITFAKTVEEIVDAHRSHPGVFEEMTRQAAGYIGRNYSREREETAVVDAWNSLTTARKLEVQGRT
jgi:hypothetical protein